MDDLGVFPHRKPPFFTSHNKALVCLDATNGYEWPIKAVELPWQPTWCPAGEAIWTQRIWVYLNIGHPKIQFSIIIFHDTHASCPIRHTDMDQHRLLLVITLHTPILVWLVVSTPLKNIRQLGWWNSQYMENEKCSKPPTSCWFYSTILPKKWDQNGPFFVDLNEVRAHLWFL